MGTRVCSECGKLVSASQLNSDGICSSHSPGRIDEPTTVTLARLEQAIREDHNWMDRAERLLARSHRFLDRSTLAAESQVELPLLIEQLIAERRKHGTR